MMMLKILLTCGLPLLARSSVVAATTNFTFAEGYRSGPASRHSDWGGDIEAFIIDPYNDGKLLLDDWLAWRNLFHKSGQNPGTGNITVGLGFSFNRNGNATLNMNSNCITIGLYNRASLNSTRKASLGLERVASNPRLYRLRFWRSEENTTFYKSSIPFDELELGFTNTGDMTSNKLWLELTLILSTDTLSQTAFCKIKNDESGEVVRTLETSFSTDGPSFSQALYPLIRTGDSRTRSHVFKRLIWSFTAAVTKPRVTSAPSSAPVVVTKEPTSAQMSTSSPNSILKRPNMIVILIDDLSTHELGCYGSTRGLSPRIDKLVKQGLLFKNAWATVTCSSTRALLMSGQYADKNGIYDNQVKSRLHKKILPKNRKTLPKSMQENGYSTLYVGKWHLPGNPRQEQWGFDKYLAYGSLGPRFPKRWRDLYTGWWWNWRKPSEISKTYKPQHSPSATWQPFIIDNGEYMPTKRDDFGPILVCDNVIEFAENSKRTNKPFFVYYAMHLTHVPWTEMYDIEADEETGPGLEESIKMLDRIIERLTEGLKETGLFEETIVVIAGDNPSDDLGKSSASALGVHVPYMVLGGSNHFGRTGTTDQLTDIADIYPTFLDFAGVDPSTDSELDGKSLKPFLTGKSDFTRKYIFAYTGPHRVVRDKNYCLDDRWFWRCHPSGNVFLFEQLNPENLDENEMAAFKRLKKALEKHPPVPDEAIKNKRRGADWLKIRDTGALSPWENKTMDRYENGLEYYLSHPGRKEYWYRA